MGMKMEKNKAWLDLLKYCPFALFKDAKEGMRRMQLFKTSTDNCKESSCSKESMCKSHYGEVYGYDEMAAMAQGKSDMRSVFRYTCIYLGKFPKED